MPLNFLSNIYDGKISLKETRFEQRDLEKEIEKLEFRNRIIDAFKNGTFLSEH